MIRRASHNASTGRRPNGQVWLDAMDDDTSHEPESKAGDDAEMEWPSAIPTRVRMPPASSLVFAWKPIIDGWDIVPGRQVRKGQGSNIRIGSR